MVQPITKEMLEKGRIQLTLEQAQQMIDGFALLVSGDFVRWRAEHEGPISQTCFETVSTYGFCPGGGITIYWSKRAEICADGEVVNLLDPTYDEDMISHLNLELKPRTMFWWCDALDSDGCWVKICERPEDAKYIMFCSNKTLEDRAEISCRLIRDDGPEIYLNVLPVGYTRAVYCGNVDDMNLQAYIEERANYYRGRHQQLKDQAAIDRDKARAACLQQMEVEQEVLSSDDERSVCIRRLMDLQRRVDAISEADRKYLTDEELDKVRLGWSSPDFFTVGVGRGMSYYAYITENVESQQAYIEKRTFQKIAERKFAEKAYGAFVKYGEMLPIGIVDRVADEHHYARPDIGWPFRSKMRMTIKEDFDVRFDHGDHYTITYSLLRSDDVDVDAWALDIVKEMFGGSHRSLIGQIYDHFCPPCASTKRDR